jgi:hypothetical protein
LPVAAKTQQGRPWLRRHALQQAIDRTSIDVMAPRYVQAAILDFWSKTICRANALKRPAQFLPTFEAITDARNELGRVRMGILPFHCAIRQEAC